MPRFFQSEIAAHDGGKDRFQNVKFKKGALINSSAAEKGGVLEFIPVHIRNPPVIQLVAYVTSLSDRFASDYAQEQPFGRTNPYYIWKGNSREISLSVDIPSSGISKALDNINNLSWLMASLYPSYKDSTNSNSVAASPLHRVRYGSLICSSTNSGQGLLCVLKGATVSHITDQGFININPKNMGSSFANAAGKVLTEANFENYVSENKNILIPKLMKLSLNLSVVQDHPLGWDFYTGEFRGGRKAPGYPYDFPLVHEATDPPPAISPGASKKSPTSVDTIMAEAATGEVNSSCQQDTAGGGQVVETCD
jgi:hypothetical protein